ncbi:MAG: hypothetical protein Q4E64_08130 [Phascolarctobacterium sp.]|uniref:hypothetical protein n=1 Tax=Phascolarctobacterium sp. TaxID=2049039 RepID=UPI0026DCA4C5|nr:hypothetical protein [Phascolarctobacterium sp.]MDO4921777.1 hypothetical protein [Phascolarctobacterium sp.]
MNKEEFKKEWQHFLVDIGKVEKEVAEDVGQFQQNLNKKINSGSIKYIELSDIVEKYGYSIKIHKQE